MDQKMILHCTKISQRSPSLSSTMEELLMQGSGFYNTIPHQETFPMKYFQFEHFAQHRCHQAYSLNMYLSVVSLEFRIHVCSSDWLNTCSDHGQTDIGQ